MKHQVEFGFQMEMSRVFFLLRIISIFCLTEALVNITLDGSGGDRMNPGKVPSSPEKTSDSHSGNADKVKPICDGLTCSARQYSSQCHCDELCQTLGDCCMDAWPSDAQRLKFNKTLLELLTQHSECVSFDKENYRTVTTCPQDSNALLAGKCEDTRASDMRNIAGTLKRMRSDGLPIVFRNKFCADCHGFSDANLIMWDASLKCVNEITKVDTMYDIMKKCRLIQKPQTTDSLPRSCYIPRIINLCPLDVDRELSSECSRYIDPVKYFDKQNLTYIYKNQHCALCNGIQNTKYQGCALESNEEMLGPNMDLNIIVSFSFNQGRYTFNFGRDSSVTTCPEGMAYSHISEECLNIECPSGFSLVNGACEFQSLTRPVVKGNVNQSILLISNSGLMETSNDKYICLSNFTNVKYSETVSNVSNISFPFSNFGDELLLLQQLKQCIYDESSWRQILLSGEYVLQNFAFAKEFECPKGDLRVQSQEETFNPEGINRILNQTISVSDTNYSLSVLRYRFHLLPDHVFLDKVWFCKHKMDNIPLNCTTFIAYGINDFIFTNEEAKHKESGKHLGTWSYFVEDSKLYICGGPPPHDTGRDRDPTFSTYLTLVCLSVSVLSLLIILITHCIFPEMFNLHGKCLVSFCFVLALTQFLVIAQWLLPDAFCRPLAVLLHYTWLTVFLWSGILGFDLARKLSIWTLTKPSVQNDGAIFMKYSLTAWIIPAVLVCLCVVLDATSHWTTMEYGKEDLTQCWIGNPKASLYAFVLPFSVNLAFNLLCLFIVICGLESARKDAKMLQKSRKERGRCVMYTKIFLLVSLTWIIAYLASFVNEDWMYTLSTVVNGLQGLFMLIGFIHNGRLRKIMRQRKYKLRGENNTTLTSTTSSPNTQRKTTC